MSERHPDDATIALWVGGALDESESAAFEHHVIEIGCASCAARLEQQARLEVAMHEAAAHMRSSKRRPSARQSMPAGLALAASLVLVLGLPGRWLTFEGVETSLASRGAIVDATHSRSPLELAPICPADDDPSRELCDDPTASFELEGALAMTMPELAVDDGVHSGPEGRDVCEDVFEGADGGSCGDDGELFSG